MGSGHKLMNSYHVPPRIVLRTTCMYACGAAAHISRNLELQNSLIPTTDDISKEFRHAHRAFECEIKQRIERVRRCDVLVPEEMCNHVYMQTSSVAEPRVCS